VLISYYSTEPGIVMAARHSRATESRPRSIQPTLPGARVSTLALGSCPLFSVEVSHGLRDIRTPITVGI
jgi:hypothetical protein